MGKQVEPDAIIEIIYSADSHPAAAKIIERIEDSYTIFTRAFIFLKLLSVVVTSNIRTTMSNSINTEGIGPNCTWMCSIS